MDKHESTTPGRLAYEAYSQTSGGRSLVSGQELPDWDGTRPEIRDAWEAAATAVLDQGGPEAVRFAGEA